MLLPRRLADRIPVTDPGSYDVALSSRPNTWGLAERLKNLPGISQNYTLLADNTSAEDYFIESSYVLRCSCSKPQLFCHIDHDGILLPGISPLDKEQVLQKEWATRADDSVNVFLPRDSIEMEIAWRIVLLAYQFWTSAQARSCAGQTDQPILPTFSSTAKYWM
jgi:hypothetical protein